MCEASGVRFDDNACVIVQKDGTGRVAVGGIAHKPWRVEAAEADLPRGAKAVASGLLATRNKPG